MPELQALAPAGDRRMSANPHANGGLLAQAAATCRIFATTRSTSTSPAQSTAENTYVLGQFLRDVMRDNMNNFRVFGPDETASNRLQAIYEASQEDLARRNQARRCRRRRAFARRPRHGDAQRAHARGLDRRLRADRAPRFFSTPTRPSSHIIDSMFNQHAKWLEKSKTELPWRAPISSLNLLITSIVWRQDHNGFTHQDPGLHRRRHQQEPAT